jgi:D-glycero-beta-D-manno-heptose-7-phosphate kinase
MNQKAYEIISSFKGKTILVVGDVMLDEYIWGEVERISPEAPVPVVRVKNETWVLGGAANVAHNISSLGGRAVIAGVIGDDSPGRKLSALLQKNGIDARGLVVDQVRPTVTKSRILAGHQQVVRIDREVSHDINDDPRTDILKSIHLMIDEIDGIILEDYAKGVINQELIRELIDLAESRNIFIVVDPNSYRHFLYNGASLVTPNHKEAVEAAGLGREVELEELGRSLLKKWGSKAVLITLGEDGMCLFEEGKESFHIPTIAQEVFDVSGAGDTVIGTVSLSLAAGFELAEAAGLANYAAGVVVGKLGTAMVTPDELRSALNWQ